MFSILGKSGSVCSIFFCCVVAVKSGNVISAIELNSSKYTSPWFTEKEKADLERYQLSKNARENTGDDMETQRHEKKSEMTKRNSKQREMALEGRAVHERPCAQSEQKTDDYTHSSSGDGCDRNNQKVAVGNNESLPNGFRWITAGCMPLVHGFCKQQLRVESKCDPFKCFS